MSSFDSDSFDVNSFSSSAFDIEEIAGAISGTSNGTSSASASLTAFAFLSGSVHGSSLAVGTIDYIVTETQSTGGTPEKEKHLPYKNHPWIDGPIRRYIEEVEPEIVEAVIEVVAKTVEKRTVQNKDVEAAQAEKALRERLASQHQAWKEMYAQLILLEYERREQEYEDAQIAMLLFDL